ncbi:MAG: TetR/AcrR family transcriptional regulator [candidate division WOR-3 bacterium]
MTVSKKAMRDAIVDAARYIFARFGYRKATMDAIARAARKGKSSVYYYFKNKEEIFLAVIEKEASAVKSEIRNALASASDPKEKLTIYVLTRMRVFHRIARFYSSFREEYFKEYDFIQRFRENYDRYETKLILDILREGIKKNIFAIPDPVLAANYFVTALKGFEYLWGIEEDIGKLEKKTEAMLEMLYRGILKR